MNEIFIVYKTDTWHSYASRDIIGVATSEDFAINICQQQATKEGDSINEEQLFNLRNLKQTQGYEGKGEFQFEEVMKNILL